VMKPSRIKLGVIFLAILVCAASIKALYHHHTIPTSLSSFDLFTWRARQLLSYAWVRLTNPPKYGTLRWDVQQAKLHGDRELQSISIGMCCAFSRDTQQPLQDALPVYAVIVAEPIKKNTYADESEVKTWYKFKIIETLNPKPSSVCAGCFTSSYLLKDLPPIA